MKMSAVMFSIQISTLETWPKLKNLRRVKMNSICGHFQTVPTPHLRMGTELGFTSVFLVYISNASTPIIISNI